MVKPETYSQSVKLKIPTESASIAGTIEKSVLGDTTYLHLWGVDSELSKAFESGEERRNVTLPIESYGYTMQAFAEVKDGKFRVDNLPPGLWYINDHATRTMASLFSVEVRAGEKKKLALTKANTKSRQKRIGFCEIKAYTPDGALTPCHVTLKSPAGKTLEPQSVQRGSVSFVTPAAGPHEATVRLSGFQTEIRTLTPPKVNADGTPSGRWQIVILLKKSTDAPEK